MRLSKPSRYCHEWRTTRVQSYIPAGPRPDTVLHRKRTHSCGNRSPLFPQTRQQQPQGRCLTPCCRRRSNLGRWLYQRAIMRRPHLMKCSGVPSEWVSGVDIHNAIYQIPWATRNHVTHIGAARKRLPGLQGDLFSRRARPLEGAGFL